MASRLTAEFWVASYLTRLRLAAIPAFLVKRGDSQAGAVLVKQATLDGQAELFHRSFDLATGARHWEALVQGDEALIDAAVGRQKARDPDLWVIEVEDRAGRSLLNEDGLG
ncbi:MAG: hypothetical protein ACI9O0_000192 [Paracoccaceae bacterium]|jgi:hypothetical protein